MADHFLYRKNGGQVVGLSVNAYSGFNATYYDTAANPALPDGKDLGTPKLFAAGTVRNATAPEIANFSVAQAADEMLQARQEASDLLDTAYPIAKLHRAVLLLVLDELNVLRAWITDFKADVSGAATLAALKTAVAADADLPARTNAQLVAAIRSKLSAGTAD